MYLNIYFESKPRLIHLWDDKAGYKNFKYKKSGYKLDKNGTSKTIFGDNVTKVNSWSDSELEMGIMYETDVRPEIDTLLNLYLNEDEPSKDHKILFFDIETEKTDKYSTAQAAENRITALSAYDTHLEKKLIWLLDDDDRIKSGNFKDCKLFVFTSEEKMLLSFLAYWQKLRPTIISGWNIDYYDIPYLINRIVGMFGEDQARILSPIKIIVKSKDGTRYTIAGVTSLDQQYLYKYFNEGERPDYKLDTIAKIELGRGKVDYTGGLQDFYENDIDGFLDYVMTDTMLCFWLNEKLRYVDSALILCHECHVSYDMVWMGSFIEEGAILTHTRKNNIVVPNRKYIKSDKVARGGKVRNPKSGLYKWVYDLDLARLYPSIICTLNISPETKMGKIANWDEMKYFKNQYETLEIVWGNGDTTNMDFADFKQFITESKINIASNGVMFRSDIKGLLPEILEKWASERDEFKKQRAIYKTQGNEELTQYYNTKQWASKRKQNTLYGVLLLPSFRFSDFDNGEAVTTTGQSVINFTIKVANKHYQIKLKLDKYLDSCVYSDTDSIYMSAIPITDSEGIDLDKLNDEDAAKIVIGIAKELQDVINKGYDLYAYKFHNVDNHSLQIKQEMVAKRGLWLTVKKRYAQWIVNAEGVAVNELDVKGLDSVRSDFPTIFRKSMQNILTKILHDGTNEEITDIFRELKSTIHDADLFDIMLPTGAKDIAKYDPENRGLFKFVKATPIHVKSALAYNDLMELKKITGFKKLANGDKILYAYLVQNEYGLNTMALSREGNPEFIMDFVERNIDRNKIFHNILEGKIQDFYNALNWGKIILNKHSETFFEF